MRHATAPQPDLRSGLDTRPNLQILIALDSRYPRSRPQCGLRDGEVQVVEDLGSVPSKAGMRRHVDGHVQVARRPAARPGLALAGEADLMPLVDAGRDRDAQLLALLQSPVAVARRAGFVDHAPLAVAAHAFGDVDHLAEHRLADGPDFTAAAAGRAGYGRAAQGRAAPTARGALIEGFELDLALDPAHGLVERDPKVVSEVRAGRPSTAPGTTRRAAHAGEESIEQIAEPGEALRERRAAAHVTQPGPPDHVVDLAPLRVRENLVGLVDLLEAIDRARLGADVRVPLLRELAEGAFDRGIVGVPLHTEDLVVTAFGCHLA